MNPNTKKPLKVGLVGFGKSAQLLHAPLIEHNRSLELSYIVQRHSDRARRYYPKTEIVRSFEELLETDVDVVVLLTPNPTCAESARRALQAGKHVVLEPPFSLSESDAENLVLAGTRLEKVVSVFQHRRWDGDFQTVKKLLQSGRLGEVREFESRLDTQRSLPKTTWIEENLPGTSALNELGTHLIDQALVLFGRPKRIWADIRSQRGTRGDDFFEIIADYGDTRCVLKGSFLVAEPTVRFLLRGSQGSFFKYGQDPQEAALKKGETPGDVEWGRDQEHLWGQFFGNDNSSERIETVRGNYTEFYDDLVRAVSSRRLPAVTALQARDIIKFLELARASQAGGRWIEWEKLAAVEAERMSA